MKKIQVAVIAGTPVDTKMGVDYLISKGTSVSGYPVSSTPEEQSALQIYKIFISCDCETQNEIRSLELLPTVRYTPNCLFIEPDDKYPGIVKMMEHFNAPIEEVVVFGDGMNDIKMFRKERTSIAMGNAKEALKEKATFVTKDSDKQGIEYACKYFGWI